MVRLPSQKQLEPLLPVLKRPIVAAFFTIEFILLFSHAPFYSFYSNFLKSLNFSTTEIGFLWAMGVCAEIFMFSIAPKIFQRFSWRSFGDCMFTSDEHTLDVSCTIFTLFCWSTFCTVFACF